MRLSRARGVFAKGYSPTWSDELFKVVQVHASNPATYSIQDIGGEEILGAIYEEEMTRATRNADDVYKIDNVIKTRRRRGRLEYFVHWKGWPAKFDSWVSADDVTDL